MSLVLRCQPHPLFYCLAFRSEFPQALGAYTTPTPLARQLSLAQAAPVQSSEAIRNDVRALLRYGGFKPSGRSKPASEYLVRAVENEQLASINLAVDACNVASLHSGLPISVVDLAKAMAPYSVAVVAEGNSYIFNVSGQLLDLGGLLCLHDAAGPCANAVKDAQRTKTDAQTQSTLSVVWGPKAHQAHCDATVHWYRALLAEQGVSTHDVTVQTLA